VVNVSVAVPYRESDDRRKELWQFTYCWLVKHHPNWPIVCGSSPDGPFNRGAAINDAARRGGQWDVLVVHDADNICDPTALRRAVNWSYSTGQVYYPFRTYTYLDEFSSNRLMHDDVWFVSPEEDHARLFQTTVRLKHYSGIQVIPRPAYEAVGGYIELTGWGAEDDIMNTLFDVYANGSEWLEGAAFHLWHPANRNNPHDKDNVRNHMILNKIQKLQHLGSLNAHRDYTARALRGYLEDIGHHVP